MKKIGTKSKTKLYIITEAVLIAIIIGAKLAYEASWRCHQSAASQTHARSELALSP